MIRRTHILAASMLSALAIAPAPASAANGDPSAHAAKAAKVLLRHTSKGSILVNSSGFTLYRFSRDARNKDMCVKISECAASWPALKSNGKPVAGPGVKASLLSTIALAGGARQVTYAGYPLYTYQAATEHGETAYIGEEAFGGKWYAVNAAGKLVK